MLLNEQIDIITNRVMNLLLESTQIDKRFVYHCARNSNSDDTGYRKIFKFGFERFYVSRGIGNMYGPGVYTTIDLHSSVVNAHRGDYGHVIIRAEILSYDKYIIWDEELAQQVYGNNWHIKNQFNIIFPDNILNRMKSDGIYHNLTSPLRYTSDLALSFWRYSQGFSGGANPYHHIDGFVFNGRRDGRVAVVKDVKNLSPYEYSLDYGRTWHKGQTEQTIRYTKNDFDVQYRFGHKYEATFPPEFGWAKVVKRGGLINYINRKGEEISPVWFDGGGNFVEMSNDNYIANIVYKDNSLWLTTYGEIYVEPSDEYPLCRVDELSDYIS